MKTDIKWIREGMTEQKQVINKIFEAVKGVFCFRNDLAVRDKDSAFRANYPNLLGP